MLLSFAKTIIFCLSTLPFVAANSAEKIVITGSSTVAPLVLEIAKRFEKQNPDVRIDVQTGGSGKGIADARSGLAAIGMVSRALKIDEADLIPHVIAYDGVTLIVHKSNPITTLTNAQVRDIYTGNITRWSLVGGKDAPIVVVNKAEGRSTLEVFAGYFGLKNSDIKPQVVIGDNQQGIKTVIGNPLAIGYVSIGSAEYETSQKAPLKLLPLDGVKADSANVQAGKFPLSRQLVLATKIKPEGTVKRFIDFAQSTAVHDLVTAQYFVSYQKNKAK
jgi:phosphate transport system substrate-binding protein